MDMKACKILRKEENFNKKQIMATILKLFPVYVSSDQCNIYLKWRNGIQQSLQFNQGRLDFERPEGALNY